MSAPKLHQPTIDFLTSMQGTCHNDDDLDDLMDGIARTLGNMFGHQSDALGVSERFVGELREAVDAVTSRGISTH